MDTGTVKKIEGDNPNKLLVGTKSGTPKKAVGDAKKAKIVDPIGKGEKGFRKEELSFKEKLDNWGIGLKAEKAVKKQYGMRSESLGVARARKFYQKDDE